MDEIDTWWTQQLPQQAAAHSLNLILIFWTLIPMAACGKGHFQCCAKILRADERME